MYLGRHYPRWKDGTEGYWCEVDGTAVTKVPQFYYSISPILEGRDDDEWYGMVFYTLHVVNPLRLKFPDTTNTGEDNVNFMEDVYDHETMMGAMYSLDIAPVLCLGYNESVENANDLFSTQARFHCNYWTADFSIYDMFVEGETPKESIERIKDEHPVFGLIEASVTDGDMSTGILAGTLRFEQEVSEHMPEPLTNENVDYVRRFRSFLRQTAAEMDEKLEMVHFNCETGACHQCKYGSEPDVVWRGRLQGEDIFDQFLEEVKEESIELSSIVLNNFRELATNYSGDCRAIMPMITPEKDIIFHWRPGPFQVNTAMIRSDGTMFIQADKMPRSAAFAHIDGFKELKYSKQFNVDVLSKFISEGDLTHD